MLPCSLSLYKNSDQPRIASVQYSHSQDTGQTCAPLNFSQESGSATDPPQTLVPFIKKEKRNPDSEPVGVRPGPAQHSTDRLVFSLYLICLSD